jgi:hypothetical protein
LHVREKKVLWVARLAMWARQVMEASPETALGPAMVVGVPRSLGAMREVGCRVVSSRE